MTRKWRTTEELVAELRQFHHYEAADRLEYLPLVLAEAVAWRDKEDS